MDEAPIAVDAVQRSNVDGVDCRCESWSMVLEEAASQARIPRLSDGLTEKLGKSSGDGVLEKDRNISPNLVHAW